jgi:hypothetical protein
MLSTTLHNDVESDVFGVQYGFEKRNQLREPSRIFPTDPDTVTIHNLALLVRALNHNRTHEILCGSVVKRRVHIGQEIADIIVFP